MADVNLSVHAFWDEEAEVWVAQSDDIPGLVTEAPSIPELKERLDLIIPELLEANRSAAQTEEIPYRLLSELTSVAHRRP